MIWSLIMTLQASPCLARKLMELIINSRIFLFSAFIYVWPALSISPISFVVLGILMTMYSASRCETGLWCFSNLVRAFFQFKKPYYENLSTLFPFTSTHPPCSKSKEQCHSPHDGEATYTFCTTTDKKLFVVVLDPTLTSCVSTILTLFTYLWGLMSLHLSSLLKMFLYYSFIYYIPDLMLAD